MTKQTNKAHYHHVFEQWATAPVKLGPMPTEAELATAHAFGRPGKQSLGLAMALRDKGMTDDQMKGASALFDGKPTPCRNHIADFVKHGSFTRALERGVIKLTLTARGKAIVDKQAAAAASKAADKPVKAKPVKGTAKANKAKAPKAKPVEAPVEPATEAPATEAGAPAAP